jgi:hypothetical protein
MHSSTRWKLTPSLIFDALCWVNVLTGDPFYIRHYQQDYDAFKQHLTSEAMEALSGLKTKVKDKGLIISALLVGSELWERASLPMSHMLQASR